MLLAPGRGLARTVAREANNGLGAEFIRWNVGKSVGGEKGQIQKVREQMVAGPEGASNMVSSCL